MFKRKRVIKNTVFRIHPVKKIIYSILKDSKSTRLSIEQHFLNLLQVKVILNRV